MTVKLLTCVTCKRAFPANGELAAIPDGRKVAFDELRHRAWRICGQCGTWNLLGAEATAAALPELLTRYAAGVPELNAGIGVVHLGSKLDLVRIDDRAVEAASDMAVSERRRKIDRRSRLMRVAVVLPGVCLLGWVILKPHGLGAQIGVEAAIVAYLVLLLDHFWIWRRYGDSALSRDEWIGYGLGITATVAFHLCTLYPTQSLRFRLGLLACLVGAALLLDRLLGPRSVNLKQKIEDGTALRFNRFDIVSATVSWNANGIGLHDLPEGRGLSGPDAITTLRSLLRHLNWNAKSGATEAAHQLVRATGGLDGLLLSLDGWREDRGGRVPVVALPSVYRVALDLALAQRAAGIDGHTAIRERADEAATIATEAEALDEPA